MCSQITFILSIYFVVRVTQYRGVLALTAEREECDRAAAAAAARAARGPARV